jgi:hypothetical protein
MTDRKCETCAACRYWHNPPNLEKAFGVCRRYPPQRSESGDWWPVVGVGAWCGEWQPKEARDD